MKKVLLTTIVSLFFFSNSFAMPTATIGLGINQGVFAAEGKEKNFSGNEGSGSAGVLDTTTVEYGAFEDIYPSIYIEGGNETFSLGVSFQADIETPKNINEANMPGTGTDTSQVSAEFQDVLTFYGLVRLPYNLYAKAGIVQGDIIINETQRSGNTYPDQDLDGYVVGFGYEHDVNGLGVRFELLGHSYDDVEANNGIAKTVNRNEITVSDMIGASAQLSVNKSF